MACIGHTANFCYSLFEAGLGIVVVIAGQLVVPTAPEVTRMFAGELVRG